MVRLKYWRLWAPALIGATMVVAFVPGREFDYGRGTFWARPRSHLESVRRAEQLLLDRIAELDDRARLLAEAPGRPGVERGPLRVVYTAPITRANAEAWADAILRDIDAVMHAASPRGRAVVYLTSWDSLARLRSGPRRWGTLGPIGALPCMAFVEASDTRLAALQSGESPMVLGGCSFALALGVPAPAINGWLTRVRRWDALGGGYGPEVVRGDRRRLERYESIGPIIRDCVEGDADAPCAQLAAQPSPSLLYWLLREHGREGLERFWGGGPTPDDAMRAAAGRSMASAMRELARERYDVSVFQVELGADHVSRAGLTLGLGLLIGVLVARRRQLP